MFDKSYELLVGIWDSLLAFSYLSWTTPIISLLSTCVGLFLPIVLFYVIERIICKVWSTGYKNQHLFFKITMVLQTLWGILVVKYMHSSLTGS
ncbi:hypothetical protein VP424E501_P0185 [Vibrio phage 424E50-1]|nr:hypothetical protein VP424E501_P0185 [Vibrio phage 424E50-1]